MQKREEEKWEEANILSSPPQRNCATNETEDEGVLIEIASLERELEKESIGKWSAEPDADRFKGGGKD
jgi:hypothetical protein